jgi:murein DD-endopeptidase MepM/ murein hydrolase activator NlpD
MKVMVTPLPHGVLTRHDDPATITDERLHDQNSRDVGVAGNVVNWPVLSLFSGTVVTADLFGGYGKVVRVEGEATVMISQIRTARVPWPLGLLFPDAPWQAWPDNGLIKLNFRVLYGHLNEVWVKVGDRVQLFQPLGGMGNTGKSQGAHLHVKARLLDLKEPQCFVDPLPLFRYFETSS